MEKWGLRCHMACPSTRTNDNDRPVAIAPAPVGSSSADRYGNGHSSQSLMEYTCQTCSKRKVKCDKVTPTCSSCRKSNVECSYQAPPPRRRKRKLSGDADDRLARYESILREHGLLPQDNDASCSTGETSATQQEPISLRLNEPETSTVGKLLTGQGKSRYINNSLWRSLENDEIQHMSDEEEEGPVMTGAGGGLAPDPLTGAFLGLQQGLRQYHPPHSEAMMLWKTHVENVEPLCKILHIPSTTKMVETVSQQPAAASKADECLLFALYHFAVFSMTDRQCLQRHGQPRDALLQRYRVAAQQALVNASFLRTTDISIMQALVLFLMPCRYFYDAQTYWILTGVSMRIAQRMGLHRDGEKLGLPPFDVQMRRRLFYQLLPLDGNASQSAGTGLSISMPHTWDTEPPLNINDDEIWPGMTDKPEERKGATDMIFCLARSYMGRLLGKSGSSKGGADSGQFQDDREAETAINKAESEVEDKFIRYCDIVNPLHLLTIGMARSGITAMRLRIRLSKARNQTISRSERKEAFQLALKIIETDSVAHSQPVQDKYRWYVKPFFLWGSWESLVFVLTTLWKPEDLLSTGEVDETWRKIEQVYCNHAEFFESKRALHQALCSLTLKAWDANPPLLRTTELDFITNLRSHREGKIKLGAGEHGNNATKTIIEESSTRESSAVDRNVLFETQGVSGDEDLGIGSDLEFDPADWMFWDQLIQDYQAQGG